LSKGEGGGKREGGEKEGQARVQLLLLGLYSEEKVKRKRKGEGK